MLRRVLFMIIANGVFGIDGNEVKSVSVMEGKSVTLNTGITEIKSDHLILWIFESPDTLIAEIIDGSIYDTYEERFRDRLKLDIQTGSLSITNIRTSDSGLYKLQISSSRGTSYRRFSVTVYEEEKEKPHRPMLEHSLVLSLIVGPLLVVLLPVAVIVVISSIIKKKIKQAREAQVPPAETQLSLIPDVNESRSQIEKEMDACQTPEDLVAEDVC